MRLSTILSFAAAVALVPASVQAAPVRAASALPAKAAIGAAPRARAATPSREASQLVGFPILLLVGVIGTLSTVAILVSGRGRSPG